MVDSQLGVVLWVSAGVAAAFSTLALWAWNHTHKRIDDAVKSLSFKAEDRELLRQRDIVNSIFTQMRQHEEQDRNRFEEIGRSVVRIETQLSRVVSDIESEKATRARVNSEVITRLDQLLQRKGD